MTHILIAESNSPDMVARGLRDADPFVDTFRALDPDLKLTVVHPYRDPFAPALLAGVDGVVFTGSGVAWCVTDVRAAPLAAAMRLCLDSGLPVWGSCNGMQLAAHVLGGGAGASLNGVERGMARDIRLTVAGRAHPMMAGRRDGFAVPCIHRDEVTSLPPGAVCLAGNAHSPVQAFALDKDGVDFWGVQYHPETSARTLAGWIRSKPAPGAQDLALARDLELAEDDAAAAKRVGATPEALTLSERALELANWLAHVRRRQDARG